MGYELHALLGDASILRRWKTALPARRVVCLGGDLGMVPITWALQQQLRARLTPGEKGAHDTSVVSSRWAQEASVDGAVAYADLFEFGDWGHEKVTIWLARREVIVDVRVGEALAWFREVAHVATGGAPIDLERYRRDTAAERWAELAEDD